MASLSFEKRANKRQARVWFEVDGKRKSVRLGAISKRNADTVLGHVRELETCKKLADTPPPRTQDWLRKIDDEFHEKLSAANLAEPRDHRSVKQFFDKWANDTRVGERTRRNRRNTVTKVTDAFGADTRLSKVTAEMAEAFFVSMTEKYSRAHANKLTKRARQVFGKAERLKIIDENPFADIKIGDESNPERQVFIDQATIEKVIDKATDKEFKLVIALARYAGLRIPSEIVGLKWGHVNWESSRIEITDVKRGRTRIIPIFSELRPYLEAVWDEVPDGTVYMIPRYQSPDANLRSRLLRTIKRAGLTPWAKPWQNLRSSRETELADQYPIQVVTSWIGNSVAVANRHYLQVTDTHFDTASNRGAKGGADMVQKLSAGANMVQSPRASESKNLDESRNVKHDEASKSVKAPSTGFEPVTY